MPVSRKRAPLTIPLRQIRPVLKPVVQPVLTRLDRVERLLEDLKSSLDVQFKRTAAIQAQVDHLVSALSRR